MNKRFVQNLKKNQSDALCIYVHDNNRRPIGILRLIREVDLDCDFIIESLTKWRAKYMEFFLTRFQVSNERTKRWLKDFVIPSDDRLLFVIYDQENRLIGNIGLANIEEDRCELDNVIRGEEGGHPKLIKFALIALLSWLFNEHNMNLVYVHVLSNNRKAIRRYSSVGFKEIARYPLFEYRITNGDIVYKTEESSNSLGVAPFEYVKMRTESNYFNKLMLSNECGGRT